MERVELGDVAKDSITGFKGVVVAITKWLHGCHRITIQPKGLKNGKPIENNTFDEPQVILVSKRAHKGTNDTGGPTPPPYRKTDPI